MDEIFVEIYLPFIEKTYDVQIPLNVKLYEITKMVGKALAELSDNQFINNDNTVLCNRLTGEVFNINLSAGELGICNGSRLMLI